MQQDGGEHRLIVIAVYGARLRLREVRYKYPMKTLI